MTMRSIALELHNEFSQTQAALRLVSDLLLYTPDSHSEKAVQLASSLREDRYTLRVMSAQKSIADKSGDLAGLESQVRDLITFAKGDDLIEANALLEAVEKMRFDRFKSIAIKVALLGGGLLLLAMCGG